MDTRLELFGNEFSRGLTTLTIAMIIVAILMLWATKVMKSEKDYRITSLSAAIIDAMFMFIYDLVAGIVGDDLVEEFMPLGLSLFFTLLLANTMSLIGLQEAVTDLVVPFTLVIMLFIAWTVYAIYKVGIISYGKGMIEPNILLAPLEILGRITSPLSMALRIFGNILSGYIIMSLIWIVMGMLFTSGSIALILAGCVMSVVSIGLIGYFSVFSPVIQALVFTSLALSNFKGLVEE